MDQPPLPSSSEREAALFAQAVERPAMERAAFLQTVCGGDAPLRARLEALLAAHETPNPWLGVPDRHPSRSQFKFHCPNCTQRLGCDFCHAGRLIQCPRCRQQIRIPSPPLLKDRTS